MATPAVAHVARRLALALEKGEANQGQSDEGLPADLSGHVIIVGYGRVGQMLGAVLDGQEIPHVGLDIDHHLVADFRTAGAGIFFGDARQPEILRRFLVERAAALVITMDDAEASEQVVTAARRHWPRLVIYARARDRDHATRLIKRGATHAIPETIEASLQLGEMVLIGAGLPDDAARRVIESRRQAEQASIDESEIL